MDALDGNAGSSAPDTGSHPGVADAGIARADARPHREPLESV
jgi:hypothetical protein